MDPGENRRRIVSEGRNGDQNMDMKKSIYTEEGC
jgi:hypothetical protein